MGVALAAESAEHATPRMKAHLAGVIALLAVIAVDASVVDAPDRTLERLDRAFLYLAHDCLRRSAEFLCNLVRSTFVVKHCLDAAPFLLGEPLLLLWFHLR